MWVNVMERGWGSDSPVKVELSIFINSMLKTLICGEKIFFDEKNIFSMLKYEEKNKKKLKK